MRKYLIFYIIIFLLFAIISHASVPDADGDGVPDADDKCPNSLSSLVDQFGCDCAQKNCPSDNNPCTDDCSAVNGLAGCVFTNNKKCNNPFCSGGSCGNDKTFEKIIASAPLSGQSFTFEPNGGVLSANGDFWKFTLINANPGDKLSAKAYKNGNFEGDFNICNVPANEISCTAKGTFVDAGIGFWTGDVFINGIQKGTISFTVKPSGINSPYFIFVPNNGVIVANKDMWKLTLNDAKQGDVLFVSAYKDGKFQDKFAVCTVPIGATLCAGSGTLNESSIGSWTGNVFVNGIQIGDINFLVKSAETNSFFTFEPNGGTIIANKDLWKFTLKNAKPGDALRVQAFKGDNFEGNFTICEVPSGAASCSGSGTLDESNIGSWTGTVFVNNIQIGSINFLVKAKENPNNCISVINNGNQGNKLNIVYLGDSYSNQLDFANDVNNFMNGLLSYEPMKYQKNKINIWRVDSFQDLGCTYQCFKIDGLLCCDDSKTEQAAAVCPHDQIIIIVNNNRLGGSAGKYAATYRGDFKVGVHEFGHSFGKLRDEKSYGPYPGYDSTEGFNFGGNCDTSPDCPLWKGLPGTSCVPGCQHDEWFRPKESDSVMYDLNGDFNPVGIRKLTNLMGAYS